MLLKRSKKAVRSIDGSQAGMSQNLSEIIEIFRLNIPQVKIYNIFYSHLGMESRARGKIFHVVFEVALLFLQCGTHLK